MLRNGGTDSKPECGSPMYGKALMNSKPAVGASGADRFEESARLEDVGRREAGVGVECGLEVPAGNVGVAAGKGDGAGVVPEPRIA